MKEIISAELFRDRPSKGYSNRGNYNFQEPYGYHQQQPRDHYGRALF